LVGAELEKAGVPREKITELNWWDEAQIDDNFMIAFTPTQHFSGRGLFDRDETLWGSYVIHGPNHKIYFSGDSGYFEGFKEIGDKYGPFDYTFMECGAYNEKWHYVHMYPEETVQAHIDLKGKILHPIH
jgi:L-ascorbate metabolism protein UlaG (beta-lactamase superfamily)